MKILVACEFSGIVRDAFLAHGHDAISCDLLPSERPGPHYQGDVRDMLSQRWDMLIAFPPCTYLSTVQACRMRSEPWRYEKQEEALRFVWLLMEQPVHRICIENPVGAINSQIRKPDQIIHPWMFGYSEQKRTCLWLKNLSPLMATCIEMTRKEFVNSMKKDKERAKNRSRTFPDIAYEMAKQWG